MKLMEIVTALMFFLTVAAQPTLDHVAINVLVQYTKNGDELTLSLDLKGSHVIYSLRRDSSSFLKHMRVVAVEDDGINNEIDFPSKHRSNLFHGRITNGTGAVFMQGIYIYIYIYISLIT